MWIEDTPIRRKVSRLYNSGDYDGIGRLEGITIFEMRDPVRDTMDRFGCVTWIFQGDRDKIKKFTNTPENPHGYKEVENPKPGDLVTYFRTRFNRYFACVDRNPTHSGIYIKDGIVRSKFRERHVYDHPLGAVPENYGNEVMFFRKKRINFRAQP